VEKAWRSRRCGVRDVIDVPQAAVSVGPKATVRRPEDAVRGAFERL
jgi:hypothetical protein